MELEFVKLEFQPKIEFPKLDLLLDSSSDVDLKKKKKKKHVELEFTKLEFHLKKNYGTRVYYTRVPFGLFF